jgi:hypothetical protein
MSLHISINRIVADKQVMECGEIDFAMLLDEQRGKPLNFNFVGLYWQQVCPFSRKNVHAEPR